MKSRHLGFAAATLFLAASPGAAQRRSTPDVAHVAPYAGYMSFGSYLDGPLGTRIGNAAAPVYGAQFGIDLTPEVSFIGNVAYSSSRLEAGLPIIGGIGLADTRVLLYDAGLQLELPQSMSLGTGTTPFIQAGAGAMRTEIGRGTLQVKATNVAFNFGAGVDMPLGRALGVRVMAKDYVGRFDLKEATSFLDIKARTTHNVAYSVGVTVGF